MDPVRCRRRKAQRALCQWLRDTLVPHLVLGQEQDAWSKQLGLRRRKKGTHPAIFPGLSERRGAAGCRTPDTRLESTCRELRVHPRKSFLRMRAGHRSQLLEKL